jgi:hypothetical protein
VCWLYLFPHGKLVHYGGTLCDQTIYILKTRKTRADFFPDVKAVSSTAVLRIRNDFSRIRHLLSSSFWIRISSRILPTQTMPRELLTDKDNHRVDTGQSAKLFFL